MCGRFVLFSTSEDTQSALFDVPFADVHAPEGLPPARYNIAPTQVIPILRATSANEAMVEPARWGLFPHWKKDDSGPPLFNARAETLREKPSFRDAFKHGRCAIPMDGYYEWSDSPELAAGAESGKKIPYWITTGEVIWVAGLWATGLDQLSATIVTTDSAPPLDVVHHRMPRFLARDEIKQWLLGSPSEAAELLTPARSEVIEAFRLTPADSAVGNVRNDYKELIDGPLELF